VQHCQWKHQPSGLPLSQQLQPAMPIHRFQPPQHQPKLLLLPVHPHYCRHQSSQLWQLQHQHQQPIHHHEPPLHLLPHPVLPPILQPP
jgi:hypothetical protein